MVAVALALGLHVGRQRFDLGSDLIGCPAGGQACKFVVGQSDVAKLTVSLALVLGWFGRFFLRGGALSLVF